MDYTNKVKEIVQRILSVQRDNIMNIDVDAALTGEVIDADAVELVYIVIEVMNEFNVKFDANDFENYSMNTIRGIAKALEKHLHYGEMK